MKKAKRRLSDRYEAVKRRNLRVFPTNEKPKDMKLFEEYKKNMNVCVQFGHNLPHGRCLNCGLMNDELI